ncbi:MAG: RSP_7527 family protein [Rhodospirillales bacterium]
MTDRISLSLSPTGAHATRPIRLSPELIQTYARRARVLRSEAIACFARQVWNWLRRQAKAPRWDVCPEEALLRPVS